MVRDRLNEADRRAVAIRNCNVVVPASVASDGNPPIGLPGWIHSPDFLNITIRVIRTKSQYAPGPKFCPVDDSKPINEITRTRDVAAVCKVAKYRLVQRHRRKLSVGVWNTL